MDECWQSAMDWVEVEHQIYEDRKFPQQADDERTAEDWENRVGMYLHRAKTLGIENPLGRQAVAKAATTAVAYLESMFRRFDSVPSPGVSSGEHKGDWRGGPHHDPEEKAE
jgi:hypothetical protein